MRSYLARLALFMITISATFYVEAAQPSPPVLIVNTQGLNVSLSWAPTKNTSTYRLFYAPYPYQGTNSIKSIDLGGKTSFSINLWQNATYYVAVKSYNASQKSSEYSNISLVQIEDRGEQYQDFWGKTIKEINENQFVSDDFLYSQLPDTKSCFKGSINNQVKKRTVETLNQIRGLHHLSAVQYDEDADIETQSASLIQRANNFIIHFPPQNSKCYSQTGLDGSKSSNLSLGGNNTDPAEDLINLTDDAFNISSIGAVGHRRQLLDPFLQYTSYGQVHGASAVKVFDFFNSSSSIATNSPDFIAFPYLRYPYVFMSDKTSDKKTPWNLSIIENSESKWANQHDYFSNSKITIKQKSNDHLLHIQQVHTDTNGTGLPNNLSWIVDNWQYDTWYTVLIDNINYQSGQAGTIKYDVFIDYKNFYNNNFPLETNDVQKSSDLIQGTLFEAKDKDSFRVNLNGNVSFTGSSQFTNTAFFIEVYDADKQLLQASDNGFSLNLPNSVYTLVVTNCHKLSCYNGIKEYIVQIESQ